MARVRGSIFLDDDDDVSSNLVDQGDRSYVTVTIGSIAVHFKPAQLALLRELETATAEARRDLEAISAQAAA